jgi:hypothetical protein
MNVVLHVFAPSPHRINIFRTRIFNIYHYDSEFDVENAGVAVYYCSIAEYKVFRKCLDNACKENAMIYSLKTDYELETHINQNIICNDAMKNFHTTLMKFCLKDRTPHEIENKIIRMLEYRARRYTSSVFNFEYLKDRYLDSIENFHHN